MTSFQLLLFDITWLAWWAFLTNAGLGFTVGAINTRTDTIHQLVRFGFASGAVLCWPIIRVYVL